MLQPKVFQAQLYEHLTKFKPINARAFHAKIDWLIKTKVHLLTSIRINEASRMLNFTGAGEESGGGQWAPIRAAKGMASH